MQKILQIHKDVRTRLQKHLKVLLKKSKLSNFHMANFYRKKTLRQNSARLRRKAINKNDHETFRREQGYLKI